MTLATSYILKQTPLAPAVNSILGESLLYTIYTKLYYIYYIGGENPNAYILTLACEQHSRARQFAAQFSLDTRAISFCDEYRVKKIPHKSLRSDEGSVCYGFCISSC